jgi:thiol-disulfide isomerase/thioredoxin
MTPRINKQVALVSLALVSSVLLLFACSKPEVAEAVNTDGFDATQEQRWRVVNYWATWCGPCILEIPELNQLALDHRQQLVVWGVNFDNPLTEAERQAAITKMNIHFPVYRQDPASDLGIDRPLVLPTTFIFSPDGVLVETLVGPQTGETLLALIGQQGSAKLN